jgi:hypothetical protein
VNQNLQDLYRLARELHGEVIRECAAQNARTKSDPRPTELADAAYALREIETFLEEARKKIKSEKEFAEHMACAVTTQVYQTAEAIRTEYCTAKPDVKMVVTVPSRSKDPEKYAAMMEYLEVPRVLWDSGEEHAVVKAHWPGLVAHLDKLQAQGKPLPPGIDPNKTYPNYKLIIRGKKRPDGIADEPVQPELQETPF